MGIQDGFQLAFFLFILILITKPIGVYMERVYDGQTTVLSRILSPLETFLYRLMRVDPNENQYWSKYAFHLLVFSAISCILTYILLRLQPFLPINPAHQGIISPHLAFNTAMSFTTNTNWQSYGGESTMSYLSQMTALTLQNFFSAAVGIATAMSLIRGIAQQETKGIGNFWADLVRSNLYILFPICSIYAIILVSQGVIQNFLPYTEITTLEGSRQIIAQGPVASQVAIKMLGTNGGGFFNANAAHPF